MHLTGQSATKSLKEEWSKCKARLRSCFFGMQKKKKLLIVTCAILLRMKLDLDSWWWWFLYFPCVICQDIYNLWSAKLCSQDCKDICVFIVFLCHRSMKWKNLNLTLKKKFSVKRNKIIKGSICNSWSCSYQFVSCHSVIIIELTINYKWLYRVSKDNHFLYSI